jgi:hypothetical protein
VATYRYQSHVRGERDLKHAVWLMRLGPQVSPRKPSARDGKRGFGRADQCVVLAGAPGAGGERFSPPAKS